MLEAEVTVVRVEGGTAWVEAEPRSACRRCEAGPRCGTGMLAGWMGTRRHAVALRNTLRASTGEQIVVGVSDRILLGAATAAYILPLASMFGSAAFCSAMQMGTGAIAGAGLAGLLLGLVAAARIVQASGLRARPHMLRRGRVADPERQTPNPIEE